MKFRIKNWKFNLMLENDWARSTSGMFCLHLIDFFIDIEYGAIALELCNFSLSLEWQRGRKLRK